MKRTISLLASLTTTLAIASAAPAISDKELLVDLDADKGVITAEDGHVTQWTNQVPNATAVDFNYTDEGRKEAGSGRPFLKKNDPTLGGRNSLVFKRDELLNDNDDACNGLMTGKGYTWFTVLKAYKQQGKGGIHPHAFFGNLRNSGPPQRADGKFAGFWGAFYLDGKVWMGSRSGVDISRNGKHTPEVAGPVLEHDRWYILAGRQGTGTGTVTLDFFIDDATKPIASSPYPVGTKEPQRLAIGTERNAINHQGGESFDGEMAKFLLYGRPLTNQEMQQTITTLKQHYDLK
jgi:hypothetical protein